ncbi:MAG: PAS domain S-box protein, partial [Dehalococcoidia bacterium]|nr:PAS domain S-box protein [Dehalococcoidia bacterium]
SANPVLDREGNIIGFLAIQRDVTERMRAQAALAETEKKYRNLAENARDILMLMDLDGRIIYASRSGEKSTGYTREELEQKNMRDLLTPASLKVAAERLQARKSGAAELPAYEVEVKAKDGRLAPFELATSPVVENGELKAIQIIARDITERKRQEEAARASETKYRTLVEKLQEGVYQADTDGNLLTLNHAGALIFGFDSPDELIGKFKTADFYRDPSDRAKVLEDFTKAGFWAGEFRARRRDGAEIWLRLNAIANKDAGGKVTGSEGVIADITDRKLAEEALREREQHYRLLADNVSDVIWTTDMDLRITYASPSIERVLGYSIEEAVFLTAEELLTPEALSLAISALSEELIRENEEGVDPLRTKLLDLEMRRRDGSSVWTEFRGSFLRGPDGRPIGVAGVSRDVTERKRDEEALRASEEKYRTLVENSTDFVFLLDEQGTVLSVNRAAARVLGRQPSEVEGTSLFDLFPPESAAQFLQGAKRVFQTGEGFQRESDFGKVRKGMWITTRLNPVRDESGRTRAVLGVSKDITERKQAEERLRQSEEKFRTLFDTMAQGVIYQDAESRITSVNHAAEIILGSTLEQMQGKSPAGLRWRGIREDGLELPEKAYPATIALRSGRPVANVTLGVLLPGDRKYHWLIVDAVPQFQPGESRPYQVYTTFSDITERKLAEDQSKLQAQLLDAQIDPVYVHDFDGNFVYVNQAACDSPGYTREELLATNLRQLDAPDSAGLIADRMRELREKDRATFEAVHLHKDGRSLPFEVHTQVTKWQGRTMILSVGRDITGRKTAEEEQKTANDERTRLFGLVENAKREWETTFDAMSDGVALMSLDFKIVRANKGLANMLATTPKALVGRYCHDAICGRGDRATDCPGTRCMTERTSCQLVRQEPRLGNRWLHMSVDPLFGRAGEMSGMIHVVRDITGQKQAEEALRDSEKRFRTVFESALIGLMMSTKDGAILRANRTCQETLGYTAEEMERLTTVDITYPEDLEEGLRLLRETREGKRDSFQRDKRYLAKDGHTVWAKVIAHAIRDPNGTHLYNVILVDDITERREIERQRNATNNLLQMFAREPGQKAYLLAVVRLLQGWSGCHRAGIRLLNRQGQLPYESYAGFSREFVTAENSLSIKNDQCACIRVVTGQRAPQDAPAMTSDGSFWCENVEKFVQGLAPEERSRFKDMCIGAGHASMAITPIRHGDEVLGVIHLADEREGLLPRRAVNFLESAALLIGEALHRFGMEQEIEYSYETQSVINSMLRLSLENAALEEVCQHTLKLVTSAPWLGFLPMGAIFLVQDGPGILELKAHIGLSPVTQEICADVPFGRCLCGRAAATFEVQFADHVDERHEACREQAPPHGHYCVPILSSGKALGVIAVYLEQGHQRDYKEERFLCTVADVLAGIIEHRRAQTKVVEYEELNKLKTNLLATVSHELRTPLATIKGYATMIIDYDRRLKRDEKLQHLHSIDKAADRLTELVDLLLDMSRLEAGLFRLDRHETSMDRVIEEAVAETQLRSPQHRMRAALDGGLPPITADSKRVRQILDNLLDNAVKYSEQGTEIVVRCARTPRELLISVADQGRGIPADETDKVFDRFYRIEQRLSKDPGGLGLGLSLCKALVEAHGGSIRVESKVGAGSTFYFTLPISKSEKHK